MDSISSRIESITPSLTLSITNQVKAMKAEGEELFGLAGGEPEMDTPQFIKDAAIQALNDGKTKYTPAAGVPELREAIAEKLQADNGISYDPSQVIVNSGAKHSCMNAILAVIEEGDEVIIPSPYWVSYPEMVKVAGGVPVLVETKEENGWKITPDEFEENMTGLTKMIILNTPGNPTGAIYTEEELRAIGEVASLSKDLYNLTITVGGFSKAYSMTGWRIGYIAAPKPLADAVSKIQGHTTSNACTFSQYGALAALTTENSFVSDLRAEYDMRRQFMLSRLQAIPNISVVEPQGAFYFLVNVEKMGIKSVNFCDKLLNRYKVAAVPGIAFGHDYSLRMSYCTTLDVLNEGLSRFEDFCKSH